MSWDVYRNDGAGGPVDERAAVASLPDGATSWADPTPLAPWADVRYRLARTDGAGRQSLGRSRTVRVTADGAGAESTGRPAAPTAARVRAGAAGTLRVEWAYLPLGAGAGTPARFHVRCNPGPAVDFAAAPALDLPASPAAGPAGTAFYWATLVGLTPGTSYAVNVRAWNARGEDGNATTVRGTPAGAGPAAVDGLAAGATAAGG